MEVVAFIIIGFIIYLIIEFVKGIVDLELWALIIFSIINIIGLIYTYFKWFINKKKKENHKPFAITSIILSVLLVIVFLYYSGVFEKISYILDIYEYENYKSSDAEDNLYEIFSQHSFNEVYNNPILVKHINDSIDNSLPNILFGNIKEGDSPLDVIEFLTSIGYHDRYISMHSGISIGNLDIQEIHGMYQSNKLYGVVLKGALNVKSVDSTNNESPLNAIQDNVSSTKSCKLQSVTNHFINKYGKPHYLLISKQQYISYWHFNKKDILIYGNDYSYYSPKYYIAIFNPTKFQQFVDSKKRIEQELHEIQLNNLKRLEQQRISDSIKIEKNAKKY